MGSWISFLPNNISTFPDCWWPPVPNLLIPSEYINLSKWVTNLDFYIQKRLMGTVGFSQCYSNRSFLNNLALFSCNLGSIVVDVFLNGPLENVYVCSNFFFSIKRNRNWTGPEDRLYPKCCRPEHTLSINQQPTRTQCKVNPDIIHLLPHRLIHRKDWMSYFHWLHQRLNILPVTGLLTEDNHFQTNSFKTSVRQSPPNNCNWIPTDVLH